MDNSFTKKYFEYKYQYDFDILSKQELDIFLNIFSGNAKFDLLEKRYNFPPSDYSLELQKFLLGIVKKLFIDWHRRHHYSWFDTTWEHHVAEYIFNVYGVFDFLDARRAYKDNRRGRKPEYVNGKVYCVWYPRCFSLDKENNYI